jgi:hypothetical protein
MRFLRHVSSTGMITALAFCLATACFSHDGPSRVTLVRSAQNPAAEGSVTMDQDSNGNTRVTVEVKHLAPPSRVAEGATVYVVWARPLDAQGPARSLGALQVSDDLRGTLHAVTALHAFDVTVTAEPTAGASAPTSPPTLSARINTANR